MTTKSDELERLIRAVNSAGKRMTAGEVDITTPEMEALMQKVRGAGGGLDMLLAFMTMWEMGYERGRLDILAPKGTN